VAYVVESVHDALVEKITALQIPATPSTQEGTDTMTDVAAAPTHAEDQILDAFAQGFSYQARSPLVHSPSEHGLDFEEVSFPSRDGVPLEGWFIPAAGSDKLVIANHPMGFTRSGLPAHREPWHSAWAASGNGFEVDLTPDYTILHDAGYNVLAYDLRNHGLSGAANGGISSSGIFEARDVVGSLTYARSRPDTRDMAIGLFSRCLGCTGIGFALRNPREWARNVGVPTFLYQVRDDVLTHPDDVQTMFDNIPVADKKLQWIDGTTRRWDGYLEFQRRPEPMLSWFASHMS
jgi:uncharacterized protein